MQVYQEIYKYTGDYGVHHMIYMRCHATTVIHITVINIVGKDKADGGHVHTFDCVV